MKEYYVELCTICVEAKNKDEAFKIALEKIENGEDVKIDYITE